MEHLVEEYENEQDARRLNVLLRQFVHMFFEELHVGEKADALIKTVQFKPTGLFILMTDGIKNSKKKS